MTENKTQSGDFISLAVIRNTFYDFLRVGFRSLDFATSAVSRKKFLFVFCCVAGLALGYAYHLLKPVYYRTEMIVQSNGFSKNAYQEIINNLNTLALFRSYNDLGSELKIDYNLAKNIISMDLVGISNSSFQKDTMTSPAFKIQVDLKSNDKVDTLQTALLYYLNNKPFIKQVKESQKKIFMEKLEFITLEQAKLDSLKVAYNRSLNMPKPPTTFYQNALNPADLYRHSLNLSNQRDSVLKWLNNESEAIFLIDGFKRPASSKSLFIGITLVIGLAAGAFLGLILSLFATLKGKINY